MQGDYTNQGAVTSSPEKLLRVETDYFVAGAVYQKIYGVWSCVLAAPILSWLKGKNTDQAKLDLLKMNASWSWINLPSSGEPKKQTRAGLK